MRNLGPRGRQRAYFEDLRASGVRLVDGNSVVRDMVAEGRLLLGLTDTDDAARAIEQDAPVAAVFPDQGEDGMGTLVIPSTLALVANGPNPAEARTLIDFLLSREVERQLVEIGWCHVPLRPCEVKPAFVHTDRLKAMRASLPEIRENLPRAKEELAEVFVR